MAKNGATSVNRKEEIISAAIEVFFRNRLFSGDDRAGCGTGADIPALRISFF